MVAETTNNNWIIAGPQIHTENGIDANVAVMVKNGVIDAFDSQASLANNNISVLSFPANYHLVPGFIDMHVHGANGCDVMDATPHALSTISRSLAAEGTTSFLATTMTADVKDIETVLSNIRDFMQQDDVSVGAAILGVHLEGPFLALTKMGAQRGDKIISPDKNLVQHWQELSQQIIKLVTLAPEQPNSDLLIRYLKQQNIIPSIGHTNANYDEAMRAITAGCSHATHLFNAMRGIHQREPGTVTAALLSDNVMVELIVDGVHLHPAIVELILKVKQKDKIILITDAMRAKCLKDGTYELGGQSVHVKKGHAKLDDGTLAGSVLKMNSAIQNMLAFTGCSLDEAIKMASENPAKALGVFDKKGSIALGKDADLVVLDDALNVVLTLCRGKICYQ